MAQVFLEGTTNHLIWVMVDATDFATPESALSAAMTLKIYGSLNGNTAAPSLTASGTGSLTNDVVHVGASATGTYNIALATGDLSDSQQSFYDVYTVILADTGGSAAQQVLVIPGVRIGSSDLDSKLSDIQSKLGAATTPSAFWGFGYSDLTEASSVGSLLRARLSTISGISDVVSQILVDTAGISDITSQILGDTSGLAGADASDIASAVWAHAKGGSVLSYGAVAASAASNADSQLTAGTFVIGASNASDVASAVWAHTIGARVDSRVLLTESFASDAHSAISDLRSVMLSIFQGERGSTASATGNASTMELAGPIDHTDSWKGYYVKILGGSQADELRQIVAVNATTSLATVQPAFGSALASAVDYVIFPGNPFLSAIHSDIISSITSAASDVKSAVSNVESALDSQFSVISNYLSNASNYLSNISAIASDAHSAALIAASTASNADSMLQAGTFVLGASNISDVASRVWGEHVAAHSLASSFGSQFSDIWSRAGGGASPPTASAVAAKVWSDFESKVGSTTSDMFSAIASGGGLTASQVWGFGYSDLTEASSIGSALRVRLSTISDIRASLADLDSLVSDFYSDFQSRVPKLVATDSGVSDALSKLQSDIRSVVSTTSPTVDNSAIASAVWSEHYNVHSATASSFGSFVTQQIQGASNLLSNISTITSDAHSAAILAASHASDAHSMAAANSNILSQILDDVTGLAGADTSDMASAVWAEAEGEISGGSPAAGADFGAKLNWMFLLSRNKIEQTSAAQDVYDDAGTSVIASATVSDDGTTFTREEWS